MGIEMGRVSGPLLSENLLRNGEDLAFDTNLLYLDVNNRKIGIKNDSPTRNLSVADARTTYLVVDTQADIANFSILTNKIQNPLGTIYLRPNQTTDPTVTAKELQTANLSFTNQKIENLTADSNIEITPTGTGIVKFTTTSVNVSGWMHATGDVTYDGTITFGNNDLDSVTFNTDITSSIVPQNSTYGLGSLSKYWRKLYSVNVNATDITAASLITANNINLLLTPGHTIYVSVNGNDTNYGNHLHSTYKTIKKALTVAQPGDEIVIFPGTYTEIFPLTVPQGVSVRGMDIRNVIVKPTTGTNTNNAFLLNSETTVSFLTVKDFYSPGNGFSFASDFTVTTRSPYIQHVTVITSGPNAGNGALVDGSLANSASTAASMLFYAVTMIIPDAIGIHATNGSRVEWLNSFTYFANKGIYLTTGTLGFASQGNTAGGYDTIVGFYGQTGILLTGPNAITVTVDVSALGIITITSVSIGAVSGIYTSTGGTRWIINLGKFGSELRSMNSSNIYGTYGAIADGASTKAYLSSHNFSYIGLGNSSNNDNAAVIQENEVVAINNGIIFYDSMDQVGDFRVGNIFYVNQKTGQVLFNAQHIDFGAGGGLVFETEYGITTVNMTAVQTGNIRIHDNNIDSLAGPVNILAASTNTYLNTNVFVTGLLDVTGDTNVKGNVFLGNDVLDTVTIVPLLTQTFKPKTTGSYTLGTSDFGWNTAFLKGINVDNVTRITNNTLSTLTTNTDLRLVSAGTGNIQITSTDVAVSNSLTADGTTTIYGDTSLRNTSIIRLVTLVGDINQTGNIGLTGTLHNTDNIILNGPTSYLRSNGVKILNNQIYTVTTGDTLTLYANGTGGVVFDDKLKFTDTTISNRWTFATTNLQKSLIVSPAGTGNTVINSTKYLTIPYGNESSNYLYEIGQIRHNSTTNLYEGYNVPDGLDCFTNLYDTDLNTYITPELTPGANDNMLRFGIDGTVVATIDSSKLFSNSVEIDNLHILNNTITTVLTDEDIYFPQNGTASININNIVLKPNKLLLNTDQVLTMQSTNDGYFKFGGTAGVVIPTGTDNERRLDPVLGETRFNTDRQLWEIFNGTIWDSAIGSASFATADEVDDIMNTWAIILG